MFFLEKFLKRLGFYLVKRFLLDGEFHRKKKRVMDFDEDQLKKGIQVELEHTSSPMIALKIACDHLAEFPDYYTRLEKMEREAFEEYGKNSD